MLVSATRNVSRPLLRLAAGIGARLKPRLWAGHFGRLVIAALLLFAAGSKGYRLSNEPVVVRTILESQWLLIAAVEWEFLLGLSLLLIPSAAPRLLWNFTIATFGLFAAVSLYHGLSGDSTCGCFGAMETTPLLTLGLDISAIVVLFVARPVGRAWSVPAFSRNRVRVVFVVLLWMALGGPAAIAMTYGQARTISSSDAIVVLDPVNWIGKPFPLFPFVEGEPGDTQEDRPLRERLAKGDWLVVLYHHDCPRCIDLIARRESICRECGVGRCALLALPPFESIPAPRDNRATLHEYRGRLGEKRRWFATTPVLMIFRDGIVAEAPVPGRNT
jgi:hypothetical protein